MGMADWVALAPPRPRTHDTHSSVSHAMTRPLICACHHHTSPSHLSAHPSPPCTLPRAPMHLQAHIWVKELGRQVYLGGFEEEEQAAEAYGASGSAAAVPWGRTCCRGVCVCGGGGGGRAVVSSSCCGAGCSHARATDAAPCQSVPRPRSPADIMAIKAKGTAARHQFRSRPVGGALGQGMAGAMRRRRRQGAASIKNLLKT